MKAVFLVSAAMLFLAGAPAAVAEDGAMKVPLRGLDLNTDQGAETALKRIHAAARSYCLQRLELTGARGLANCEREMVAKAVTELGAPGVSAKHQGQTTVALTAQ